MKHFTALSSRLLLVVVIALLTMTVTAWGAIDTAKTTGTWSTTTNWSTGALPGTSDTAFIADGVTFTINQNFTVSSLIVGGGGGGATLNYDDVASVIRKDTVINDLTINANSSLLARITNTGVDTLWLGGNLTNNGTFNAIRTSGSTNTIMLAVIFNKTTGDQYIHGSTPVLTQFGKVYLSKGSRSQIVHDSLNTNIGNPAGSTHSARPATLFVLGLTGTATGYGTWEQDAGTLNAITSTFSPGPSTSNAATNTRTGFNIMGSGSFLDTVSGSCYLEVLTNINTTGTFTLNSIGGNFGWGDTATISSGTFYVYEATIGFPYLGGLNYTLTPVVTMHGGTIYSNPYATYATGGTTFHGLSVYNLGTLNMDGGTITMVHPIPGKTTGHDINVGSTSTLNITGGTINIGDGVSSSPTTALGFLIADSSGSLNNLVIQGLTWGRQATITTSFTTKSLTIAAGTSLSDSTKVLTVAGNVANSGTNLNGTGGEIKLAGGTSQHTLSGNGIYGILELNDATHNGGMSGGNATIDSLVLTAGTFSVGANTLTLHKPIGGTPSNLSAGASSSIVIGGSASGINLPSGVSALNNFTLNNASGSTLQGPLTVNGATTITNGALTTGSYTLTLGSSGTLSEAGNGNIVLGKVQSTRTVSGGIVPRAQKGLKLPAAFETFGGIGFDIDPAGGTSPGLTTVTRTTGAPQGPALNSIKRYYDVNAAVSSGLNATVAMHYDSTGTELNSNPDSGLTLWRSTDGGNKWALAGGTADTVNKKITQTGVSGLSRWTAASGSLLPIHAVNSDIVAGSLTIPSTISSNATTQANEVAVFSFTVRDGGASGDTDAVATTITGLTIQQGSDNTAANWTQYIQGANLYDGLTDLGAATVGANTLTWSGSPLVSVADDATKELTLKIYLKASLPAGADNKVLEFKTNQSTDVIASGNGSLMASGGADVVGTTGTSIAVVAAKLNFVGTIGYTTSTWIFSASVSATDTNGNIDADYTTNVALAIASGSGVLSGTIPKPAVLGVASFTDLSIVGHGLTALSAASGALTGATSNSFAVDSSAVFKVAAGGPNDTLYWDSPSTWTVLSGYSHYGAPHSMDHVILDDSFHTGSYAVKVGVTAAAAQVSDTAATIHIGYPGNTNTITLLIPTAHTQYFPGAIYWGDALPGNYDMVIDAGGLFQNSSTCGAHNAFNYPAILPTGGAVSVDSLLIKQGGKYLHTSSSFGSGLFGMSSKMDGDYGIVEYDVPSAFSDINGQNYWYPNLVLSNNHSAPTYYVYSSSNGAMYVKGNLTVNPGVKDSLGLTPDQPTMVFGNIVNNGTTKFYGGPLMWSGSTAQTVSGNPITLNAGAIVMNNAGVNLQSNLYVTGGTVQSGGTYNYVIVEPGTTTKSDTDVTARGVITTGADTLFLTPAGALSEGTYPVQGNVSSTRVLSQSHNADFGNGFQINALGGRPGPTTVFRTTGVADSGYAHNKSILRHYDVTDSNNTALNATIAVGYSPSATELNGISQSNLLLQKSTDNGVNWAGKRGTLDTILYHQITATGVGSPGARWTLASAGAPLFIPHAMVIRSFKDTVGTVEPQVAQKWHLALYQDSVAASTLVNSGFLNSGVLSTPYLASGTYILAENDSLGWLHLGKIRHGTSIGNAVISGSMRYDTIVVTDASPNSADTVDFINQPVSVFTVVKLRDLDGRLSTTGDQTAIKWELSLYKDTATAGHLIAQADTSLSLVVTNLQAGKYIAVEADSGAPWYRLNGNGTRYDTLTLLAAQSIADTFINVKGSTLWIQKYVDNDGKFATTGDRVLKNWSFAVHRDSATGAFVTSGSGMGIPAIHLGDGPYYVSEADSTGWVHVGYVVNGAGTASGTNHISVPLSNGAVDTISFVNAPPIYSQTFRTFRADSIANAGLPTAVVKPGKADKVEFVLTVVNDSANISKLHVDFGVVVIDSSIRPFTITPAATPSKTDTKGQKWDFVFVSPLSPSTHVTISGWGSGKAQQTAKYQWFRGSTKIPKAPISVAATDPRFTVNQLHGPMPNRLNVLTQAYNDVFNVGNTKTGGMTIGVPTDSLKGYLAWVVMQSPAKVTGSLFVKPSTLQTGTARGLDFKAPGGVVGDTTKSSNWLKGAQSSLSPKSTQDNELFGNLVALKLSIAASYDTITPVGLGEMIYDDGTSNPLNGMMVKDIALRADTLMTGYVTYRWDTTWNTKHTVPKVKLVRIRNFANAATYANLAATILGIDTAFEGPLDTVSFSSALVVKGTRRLVDIGFLHVNPSIQPSRNRGPRSLVTAEDVTPVAYTLYQNYPNPFNPTTTIRFDLPQQAVVTLKIYNILGQEVATLFDRQQMDNGTQEVQFNASRLASGVYFYRMIAEGMNDDGLKTSTFVTVKKMLLLK